MITWQGVEYRSMVDLPQKALVTASQTADEPSFFASRPSLVLE